MNRGEMVMIRSSSITPLYLVGDAALHLDRSGYFNIFQLD
jgi:hypothetical protein